MTFNMLYPEALSVSESLENYHSVLVRCDFDCICMICKCDWKQFFGVDNRSENDRKSKFTSSIINPF